CSCRPRPPIAMGASSLVISLLRRVYATRRFQLTLSVSSTVPLTAASIPLLTTSPTLLHTPSGKPTEGGTGRSTSAVRVVLSKYVKSSPRRLRRKLASNPSSSSTPVSGSRLSLPWRHGSKPDAELPSGSVTLVAASLVTASYGPGCFPALPQAPRRRRSSVNCGNHGSSLMTQDALDRKSTRLNSSHVKISYAVFCLKKK